MTESGFADAFRASLIWVKKVKKSIGILGINLQLKTLERQWDQSNAEKSNRKPVRDTKAKIGTRTIDTAWEIRVCRWVTPSENTITGGIGRNRQGSPGQGNVESTVLCGLSPLTTGIIKNRDLRYLLEIPLVQLQARLSDFQWQHPVNKFPLVLETWGIPIQTMSRTRTWI
ncbi:hypothetical protein B0H19DRAFT_1234508 [Mycena capillaripes]|nr:hypothetical protein B0H19DRAFT_1234508 [Mycena capillaripes]